ncbi:UDP-N-acetylmuramoyl-tripeptide--D-alanyl-D-alanine ligase [Paenibacillus puerhi]|uniref:UDP-N-acetylmuramoyl-tripeptide--D-alanyl-D- alanine ligase n=1 Tax=Paenibacillus puerhi TaxID=2692622 RepID=UPI00135B644C|nr:UDP-N-acetylmuramoyl-tripeptide--D-alanyl-D-alanine ligase [Paenibacillus puerhi]
MIKRTLAEIAEMAGGKLHNDTYGGVVVHGVSKDSRTLSPGNLYIPLIGEAFDGHRFAEAAFEGGASASLWQSDHPELPEGRPLVVVDDCLAALQRLAAAYKAQLSVRIVGITGSNGKTTTKDLTAAVLSTAYSVHKTSGNYNNHIGLPLTLLELSEDSDIAVLEMGMSGRGEIELLSSLAGPELAVITNIGDAHLLQLGSREEIARAKTEILAGLQPGGTLVYNGDEPLMELALAELAQSGDRPVDSYSRVRFGAGTGNDLFPSGISMDRKESRFTLGAAGGREFAIPLLGAHNVLNALAAYAVGRHFGLDDSSIAKGLSGVKVTGMRIEVLEAPGGLTIWNDAYNASPTAMRAALALLHEAKGFERKYACLGDMLELGPDEAELHREVGRFLDPAQVAGVFTFGPLSLHLAEGAKERFPEGTVWHFREKEELAHALQAVASPRDVVLIKGSRGMRMEQIAAFVMQLGG